MRQVICVTILIAATCLNGFSQTSENICPQIEFVFPTQIIIPNEPTIFSVKVGEKAEQKNLRFEWTFSLGKILKGQGTSQIEFVASDEENGGNLTVRVKVVGLPNDCADTKTETFGIASLPIGEPVDNFGKTSLDTHRSRLDVFIAQLANNPNAEGLIHIDLAEEDSRSYKTSLLKNIYGHLIFRKFDVTRIVFAISERKSERTVLWIVPAGGKFPKYVLNENYQIIRAEDLNQKLKNLFPTK